MSPSNVELLYGPYRTPRVKIGRTVLTDEARGLDVVVVALTDVRIPWPIGKPQGGRARSVVVCGDLELAVRHEANIAVCYWFGVTAQTVSKWRKLLAVERRNEGTNRFYMAHGVSPAAQAGRAKAHEQSRDPEADAARREKIAAAKRGTFRKWSTIQKMTAAATGRTVSPETRARIAEANRRTQAHLRLEGGRAWTAEEDDAVRTLPAGQATLATKRSLSAIYSRRYGLRITGKPGRPLKDE